MIDLDVLLAVVGADAHPEDAERADDNRRNRQGHPVLAILAIEHLEESKDGEHDRLAEAGKESGDAEDDLDRDHQRH